MLFISETPGSAFVQVVQGLEHAPEVAPHGVITKELIGVQIGITDPTSIPFDVEGRELNNRILALEVCSLLGQTPADAQQRKLVKAVADFQDDDGVQYGNYGARIRGQLAACVKKLTNDPDSRQAVMTIYDGRADLHADTYDVPCTVSVQFFIRMDELVTITTMRSNDAWLGLPYDLQQFCTLHCAMASIMGVDPGIYIHQAGSMHLYTKHWHRELGELYQNDLMHPLFLVTGDSPIGRLNEITTLCQAYLLGEADDDMADTEYEKFLMRSLRQ